MNLHRLFVAALLPYPCALFAEQTFNPDVALFLSGTYAQLQYDPANYTIPGFSLPAESEPGTRGFAIGESELALSANIDPDWYGNLTLALGSEGTAEVENAYVESGGLADGVTVRVGRFFSAIGYLNEQHAHTWEFVDTALPYRALFGTQYRDDGVQLRWLAPLSLFTEIGSEWFSGSNYPAGGNANEGRGSWSAFIHLGDDVGVSNSWRAGLSLIASKSANRESGDSSNPDLFSGSNRLLVADVVWKWAPQGNATQQSFKLQGEYLRNHNDGLFTPAAGTTAPYSATSSGWYLQGVYQFTHGWRIGLRHDQLTSGDPGTPLAGTVLDAQGHTPRRNSVMLDYARSEFSRLRLQFNRDHSGPVADDQWFLQYQMSLGAHGAHQF